MVSTGRASSGMIFILHWHFIAACNRIHNMIIALINDKSEHSQFEIASGTVWPKKRSSETFYSDVSDCYDYEFKIM